MEYSRLPNYVGRRENNPFSSKEDNWIIRVYMSMRRHVDISEMYDLFNERKNCYFICCDIKLLLPINEISMKAGDLAIIEAMERMQKEAGEEDLVFRIGSDEFVMLTNSEVITYAEQICERIRSYNGQTFDFEDQ